MKNNLFKPKKMEQEEYSFLFFKGLTKAGFNLVRGVTFALVVAIAFGAIAYFNPGLTVQASKALTGMSMSNESIDNVTSGDKLPLPSDEVSNKFNTSKLIRIAEYAWNGNSGMIVANGGPRTTKGSLMENAGLSLEIVRQDMVSELREMQVKFVEEFDKGNDYPSSDKSAFAVSIMGDGAPFYITTLQSMLDNKFGVGKYHAKAIAAYGLSFGEDKVIGPMSWKDNPQAMKGALISSVVGDGGWVLACNYAFANGIKVNPDPTTYDAEAVNFYPSEDDDYINSSKELIKSQTQGFTVPLAEVKNGVKTGKTINKAIDGCTTWAPGDKVAFDGLKGKGFTDVASTRDFVNQMATTLIVIDEWARKHEKEVISLLTQTYIATNQMKLYDEWAVAASKAVQKTFDPQGSTTPEFWYNMFKGQKLFDNGIPYTLGGTRVFNLADARQYYGLSDGNNRYKSVYDQVTSYLQDLNPMDFMQDNPKGVVPYADAVNLYYIQAIDPSTIAAGTTEKVDYSSEKKEVFASGHWKINFATGKYEIEGSSSSTLNTIYNLLQQAESTKLEIVGHTDITGDYNNNKLLSKGRAEAVVQYLKNRGISPDRFQYVDGKGSDEPISDNKTESGRAKNRRVDIKLLK